MRDDGDGDKGPNLLSTNIFLCSLGIFLSSCVLDISSETSLYCASLSGAAEFPKSPPEMQANVCFNHRPDSDSSFSPASTPASNTSWKFTAFPR